MKHLVLGFAVVLMLAGLAFSAPDVVKLNDGRVLEGAVEVGPTSLRCATADGQVTVPLSDVAYFEMCGEANDGLNAKIAETDFSDAGKVVGLAAWAKQNGVAAGRIENLYRKALALDADNAEANLALGNVKYDGRWMAKDRYMIESGHVERDGKWMAMDDAARAESDASYAAKSAAMQEKVQKNFSALMDRDQTRVSEAYDEIVKMDAELPGILEQAREVKAYSGGVNDTNVMFDGQSAVLELRISNASIDWSHPLRVTLTGGGLAVTLPLPRQKVVSIKTTIITPGGGRGGGF